jgi:hypothetical protein
MSGKSLEILVYQQLGGAAFQMERDKIGMP